MARGMESGENTPNGDGQMIAKTWLGYQWQLFRAGLRYRREVRHFLRRKATPEQIARYLGPAPHRPFSAAAKAVWSRAQRKLEGMP